MPSLALIKSHLNIDPDDTRDDELLEFYASAASAWVQAYVGNRNSFGYLEVQAVLLLVAHSYAQREAVSFSNPYSLPFGVHDLLSSRKERVTGYVPAVPFVPEPEPEIVPDPAPVVTP